MQSEVEMSSGEVREGTLTSIRKLADLPYGMVVTTTDSVLVWFQPWVALHKPNMLYLQFLCSCLLRGCLLGICLFCSTCLASTRFARCLCLCHISMNLVLVSSINSHRKYFFIMGLSFQSESIEPSFFSEYALRHQFL